MDKISYYKFIKNNPQLVQDYGKKCKKHVVQNCDEYIDVNQILYHGTTKTNAQNILDNGFIIDRFNGTQVQGIGIYTALDDDTARTFGEKILILDTSLAKLLNMVGKAHQEFNGLKSEFIKKIKSALGSQKNEYFTADEWEQKIEGKIDSTCEILARMRGISVQEKAEDTLLTEESSIVLSNMFDETITKQKGKSAILSQTRGVFMEPIEQLVIRDLNEINSINELNI